MPTAKYSGCVRNFIYDAHNIENIKDSTATALSKNSDPIILTHKTTCYQSSLEVFSAKDPLKAGDSEVCGLSTVSGTLFLERYMLLNVLNIFHIIHYIIYSYLFEDHKQYLINWGKVSESDILNLVEYNKTIYYSCIHYLNNLLVIWVNQPLKILFWDGLSASGWAVGVTACLL